VGGVGGGGTTTMRSVDALGDDDGGGTRRHGPGEACRTAQRVQDVSRLRPAGRTDTRHDVPYRRGMPEDPNSRWRSQTRGTEDAAPISPPFVQHHARRSTTMSDGKGASTARRRTPASRWRRDVTLGEDPGCPAPSMTTAARLATRHQRRGGEQGCGDQTVRTSVLIASGKNDDSGRGDPVSMSTRTSRSMICPIDLVGSHSLGGGRGPARRARPSRRDR